MNQEVTFDTSSGIDLAGWWSNPSTGESYQVVDQFFQDNSLYVKTMNGQVINFNRIQNFVRSDQPITRPITPNVPTPPGNSKLLEGLGTESAEGILPEDLELIRGSQKKEPSPEKSVSTVILDKMFSKAPAPSVTMGIHWDWDKLPSTLETLTDTMELSREEVAAYVYSKYCSEIEQEIRLRLENTLFGVAVQ